MTRNQKHYQKRKARTRIEAIEYQMKFENGEIMYWSDIIEYGDYFQKFGKRYGLLREFKENGII